MCCCSLQGKAASESQLPYLLWASSLLLGISFLWRKCLDTDISPVSDHHQFVPARKDTTSISLPITLQYVVKWVQYLVGNVTSHDSFLFYTILYDVNMNFRLWSVICNFNQPIITFIKCVVNKVLAAYILSVLKPSKKHSIITSFSCNNFGWWSIHTFSHLDFHPKGTWGLLFFLYSSKNEIEGAPNRSNANNICVYV